MKLLTYPPRVQSVGGVRVQSVASGAGWDLASRVSRLKRKLNPLLRRVQNNVIVHLRTTSLLTVGRGTSSSLEVREEPRLWSVDGSCLGLSLDLLCLSDVSTSVSSAGGVSLSLK